MLTNKRLEILKKKTGHAFIVDQNGNLTLKNISDMPPITLIYVEGDKFTMGDGLIENEPLHEVEISSFFMAEYPVTQEVYKAVTGKEPGSFKGLNHPVEEVTWFDAVEFCNYLNQKTGFGNICDKEYNFLNSHGKITGNITEVSGFRLPTEAEWEYGARGGIKQDDSTRYEYAGSNHVDDVAWYADNNSYETKPAGLKFPNPIGLYDMSGNVFEWCWDWYDSGFYGKTLSKDPVNLKESGRRVLRGGSWRSNADHCRLAYRHGNAPDNGWDDDGFRPVFALQFKL